jgi:YnbE-like lipoprotein
MSNLRLKPAAAIATMLTLGGCISVKTPEKPIEINLNVVIRQEVVVKLQRDVENLIQSNPGAFPGTTTTPPTPPKPR